MLWEAEPRETWFAEENSVVVSVTIGREADRDIFYRLLVEMYKGDGKTIWEFAFAILKDGPDMPIRGVIFDSNIANTIIPKSYRPRIRSLVFRLSEALVKRAQRDEFFMTTFCDNLPEKALTKYYELSDIFKKCGYEVEDTQPEEGRYYWGMKLKGS